MRSSLRKRASSASHASTSGVLAVCDTDPVSRVMIFGGCAERPDPRLRAIGRSPLVVRRRGGENDPVKAGQAPDRREVQVFLVTGGWEIVLPPVLLVDGLPGVIPHRPPLKSRHRSELLRLMCHLDGYAREDVFVDDDDAGVADREALEGALVAACHAND